VEEGPNGKPFIAVTSQGEKRKFYPEEISAAILLKLKQCVENYIE
jgi:molecular chaperone DnaK (HSP70)